MSRSPEQVKARRRVTEYLRETGRAVTFPPGSPEVKQAKAHVRALHKRGMSYAAMERQSGKPARTIHYFVERTGNGMYRNTYITLMSLRFELDPSHPRAGAKVNSIGSRRRLLSLWYDGFTIELLNELAGYHRRAVNFERLARGERKSGIYPETARKIAELYDKLEGVDPADYGLDVRTRKYARTFAVKQGAVPRHCWDTHTIDDPDAIAEWTGACGTIEGYRIHKREGIPVCGPCRVSDGSVARFSGERLRKLREERGLTQAAVQTLAGLGKGHLRHWESGRSMPRPATLERLASALDVTFEDLCESEET